MDNTTIIFSLTILIYYGLCLTSSKAADVSKDLKVIEGDTLRENCNASEVPSLSYVYWQKTNDTSFHKNGTVLLFRNITRNDTGYYSCVSHDRKTGKIGVVDGIYIDVLYSPRPKDHTAYNVSARYGSQALLILVSVGNPPPRYTWFHQGQLLPDTIARTARPNIGYVNVTDVDFDDYGNYTVILNNSVGSYQAVYTLIPRGNPESPTNLTVTNVTAKTVTLQWNSGFDWASPQYFQVYLYHENDPVFPIKESEHIPDTSGTHGIGANFTYTVTGLQPNTAYLLGVGAGNRWDIVGQSMSSGVTFRTTGEPTNTGSCLKTGGLAISSIIATLMSVILVTFFCSR